MQKFWIAIGLLGLIFASSFWVQKNRMDSLSVRVGELEAELEVFRASSRARQSKGTRMPSVLKNQSSSKGSVLLKSDDAGKPLQQENAISPNVLEAAVSERREEERQERRDTIEDKARDRIGSIVESLKSEMTWTDAQESEVVEILNGTFQRRMELREQVLDGEIDRMDMRDMMRELRQETEEGLEDVVGDEDTATILARLPSRGRR
jgi:hypothetical protein